MLHITAQYCSLVSNPNYKKGVALFFPPSFSSQLSTHKLLIGWELTYRNGALQDCHSFHHLHYDNTGFHSLWFCGECSWRWCCCNSTNTYGKHRSIYWCLINHTCSHCFCGYLLYLKCFSSLFSLDFEVCSHIVHSWDLEFNHGL